LEVILARVLYQALQVAPRLGMPEERETLPRFLRVLREAL
jgi:hypothetical protein